MQVSSTSEVHQARFLRPQSAPPSTIGQATGNPTTSAPRELQRMTGRSSMKQCHSNGEPITQTHTHTHTQMVTVTHTHTHTHTHIYIYIYIHTHKHTQAPLKPTVSAAPACIPKRLQLFLTNGLQRELACKLFVHTNLHGNINAHTKTHYCCSLNVGRPR